MKPVTRTPLRLLGGFLVASTASLAFGQITLTNGGFDTAITNNTSFINQSSASGTWFGNTNASNSNWVVDGPGTTYDGTAVGRVGNGSPYARGLAQVVSGASTAIGDYNFNFDYTIVDANAATPASLRYRVYGINNPTGTGNGYTVNLQNGTQVSIGGFNYLPEPVVSGSTTVTQLLSQTVTLGSASTNSTTSGSVSELVSVAATYSRYLVIFEITGTNNNWGQAQSNNFVSLDNVSFSAVPEPSAFAVLAGLGVLGFAACRRRR